jgi:hypothetical protein
MKPARQLPSPYGVLVDLYPGKDPTNPEEYVFAIEAAAIMCGIYAPAERNRFTELSKTEGGFKTEQLKELGGHSVPIIPLPRPRDAISPTIPKSLELDIPVDAWVDRLLEFGTWWIRAQWLEQTIADNLEVAKGWNVAEELLTFGLQQILTSSLEHLPDTTIGCIEAAAWFALTAHEDWQRAALEWLQPFRETWYYDWVRAHPRYRRFARKCRQIDSDLPDWILGVRR